MVDEEKEIPSFRISDKKVDDSWKEEMRREREAAARAAAGGGTARPAAPSQASRPSGPPAAAPQQAERPRERPAEPAGERPAPTPADQQLSKVFVTFVMSLAQQALMQLGEMENPYTGQREVDLQGARYSIDVLGALQVKTRGNLTPDEERAITETVRDLKLHYVEIANEVQRQMQAQAQKGAAGTGQRPGPGGTIPGPGSSKRR